MKEELANPQVFAVFFAASFIWVAGVIAASIVVRLRRGAPIYPRAPEDALYAEKSGSGASRKSLLTRLGQANNCLIIAVTGERLIITPRFPFNLMFLPEVYDLQHDIVRRDIVSAQIERGVIGRKVLVGFLIPSGGVREVALRVRDPDAFLASLGGPK